MSYVGSSPALATCETSQVLLAGVSGGFSRGSPVFTPPTDWPVSYELERDVKLNKKNVGNKSLEKSHGKTFSLNFFVT